MAEGSRAVGLSLYRMLLRWLHQPVVREVPFLAGDLPPELVALGLSRQQLTNREGVQDAIVSSFRARAALTDPAEIGQALDLGFKALQYLNGQTAVLVRARERRESNRDRQGVQFRVGEVVRHKLFAYRGVVVGWDQRPTIDVSGWDGVVQTKSGPDQPFYHVACDAHDVAHFLGGSGSGGPGRRRLMYVAQENMKSEENELERRVHSDVIASACQHYDNVAGRFVVEERIAYMYPADVDNLSVTQQQHRKNLRRSSEQAKLVDAARRVECQVQTLAQRLHEDIQRQFGVLERFEEPVDGLLALLDRMMAAPTAAPAEPPSPSAAEGGLGHPHPRQQQLSRQKRAAAAAAGSRLQQVQGGYDALRALRDLYVLAEDLHTSRMGSRERDGVAFGLGEVVRHSTLGYRGVVAGIERFPKIPLPSDPDWLEPMHPHYRLIVNEEDREAAASTPASGMVVLPQEALEPTSAEESAVVVSPLIPQFFTYYDPLTARYQPNATTRFKFLLQEEDAAAAMPPGAGVGAGVGAGAGPVEAALADQRQQQRRQEERVVARVFKVLSKLFDHVRARQGKHGQHHGLKGDLLTLLHEAMRKEDADVVETLLWHCFLAHSNERVVALMDDGVQLMMRARYPEAISRFEEVLRIDPSFAEAYNKRGTAHFLSGQYDKAQGDVLATLAREPAHFGALIGKGLIEFEKGRKVQAIKAFRAALRVHPWSTNVGTTIHHCRKLLEGEEVAIEV